MSKADQFREYAEEAMRWARQSKTEKERQALIELACTWTQAAVQSEHIFGVNDSPPEHREAASVGGLVRRQHGYHDTCDHHHRPADSFRWRLVRPGTLVLGRSKSVKEIAEIIGIAEATVKTRMFYARKKLAVLVATA
jgi:Sigma-70, region 4